MAAKKKSIEVQIELLARMVKHGFDEVSSSMATRQQLQILSDNHDLTRADIQDIKRTLGPLVQASAYYDRQLREHDKRIERLERKVGAGK